MAITLDHLLESVIPAVISGGGAAFSTILAFFKNMTKRIEDLEKRVGSLDGKQGLAYSIHLTEESVKALKEQMGTPRDAVRWRLPSFTGEGDLGEIEQKLRAFEVRLKSLEATLSRVEEVVEKSSRKKYVAEDDFEEADRERANEIAQVRTTLAEVRGLLGGLQTALGLVKPGR